MKKVKIAQIGLGHDHSAETLRSICKQSDIFEVVGYAEPEEEKGKFPRNYWVKNEWDVKEMTVEEILNYPGLDAVTIETEEKNLTKYATLAAEHGLHIHMDKPGSESVEDYTKLIGMAKEKGLVFHLGYMYRYNPAVIDLFKKINDGKLGNVYAVEAHMSCPHPAEKREWLRQFKGGMMFYLGCHLIDLILQIKGLPDEIIPLNCSTGIDGVTAEDYGMAVFKYKDGISFAKTCAAEAGGFYRRQLVVCGDKGTIEIKPFEKYSAPGMLTTEVAEVYDTEAWHDTRILSETELYNRYDSMMASFAAMARGEKQNPYTYEYELKLHKVIMKACGNDVDWK